VGDITGFRFMKFLVVRAIFNLAVLLLLTTLNDLICFHDLMSLKDLTNHP
jgi:hypothetical protein